MTANDADDLRWGALLTRLTDDISAAFDAELRAKLTLYYAVSELIVEAEQPADAGHLRNAVAHLAMQCLGVDDAAIERQKLALASRADAPTLDMRN